MLSKCQSNKTVKRSLSSLDFYLCYALSVEKAGFVWCQYYWKYWQNLQILWDKSYFGPHYLINRPYPVIWKTVPIKINILKLQQVNFCIENIALSKFQGDTRNSFPDIAFRIYINSYEKFAICTWVGTKYCILPTLSQRVLYSKTL